MLGLRVMELVSEKEEKEQSWNLRYCVGPYWDLGRWLAGKFISEFGCPMARRDEIVSEYLLDLPTVMESPITDLELEWNRDI